MKTQAEIDAEVLAMARAVVKMRHFQKKLKRSKKKGLAKEVRDLERAADKLLHEYTQPPLFIVEIDERTIRHISEGANESPVHEGSASLHKKTEGNQRDLSGPLFGDKFA